MKMSVDRRSVAARTRPGFTLIELLIVMTIIAVLAALTISASMRFISVSEVRNTEVLVQKVHDAFAKHWKAVIAKANQEQIPDAVFNFAVPVTSQTEQAQRARVLYIKLRLLREFPMNIDEATHPQDTSGPQKIKYFLPPNPTYVKALNPTGMRSSSGSAAENSACLLLALTKAHSGIVTNEEDFGAGTVAEALTASGNNPAAKGLVDFWRQPLVFCRWPTGNAEVSALNPAVPGSPQAKAFCDPQDPNGLLIPWASSNNGKHWRANIHPIVDASGKAAIFTVPVIWSFGPDKKHGQNLTNMSGPTSADNDNIYSYRLRLGGS